MRALRPWPAPPAASRRARPAASRQPASAAGDRDRPAPQRDGQAADHGGQLELRAAPQGVPQRPPQQLLGFGVAAAELTQLAHPQPGPGQAELIPGRLEDGHGGQRVLDRRRPRQLQRGQQQARVRGGARVAGRRGLAARVRSVCCAQRVGAEQQPGLGQVHADRAPRRALSSCRSRAWAEQVGRPVQVARGAGRERRPRPGSARRRSGAGHPLIGRVQLGGEPVRPLQVQPDLVRPLRAAAGTSCASTS